MAKKKKKLKYQKYGDTLGVDIAFLQAAALLDLAAQAAVDSGDPKKIRSVAKAWWQLAESMKNNLEGDSEDVTSEHTHAEDVTRVKVMGFGNTQMREKAEREHKSKS